MEYIQEAIASRNLIAWVIILLILVILVNILKNLSKGFLILFVLVGLGIFLAQVFPDFIQPFADFVRGGWLGN
ncbi:MAG: hypothetical protein EA353_14600 [Puniceicoccaceae bacterium]|nr:MAG: hypothetical protein EA353_14600 [Puniceicoccaceae bacterium]